MIKVCSWCRRTKRGDEWVAEDPEPTGNVTHGLCPTCYPIVSGEPFETWMLTGLEEVDYFEVEEAFVWGVGKDRERLCYDCGCRHSVSGACPRCGSEFERSRGTDGAWTEECWRL